MPLRPLDGFTIGITADRRADEQIGLLERRGASIVRAPSIRTHPLGPDDQVKEQTERVIAMEPEVVLFMTGIGVRGWFEAAEALGLAEELRTVLGRSQVWCRGPKATGAAIAAGLEVAWSTTGARSREMLTHLAQLADLAQPADPTDRADPAAPVKVVVQLDGSGELEGFDRSDGFLVGGVDLLPVTVYRYCLPDDVEPARQLVRATVDGRLDAVTFTSRPAIYNLIEIAAADGLDGALTEAFDEKVVPICIGPVCAEGAAMVGIMNALVPPRPRLGTLVQTTAAYFEAQSMKLFGEGVALTFQGNALDLEGRRVMLGDRERDLLRALIGANGAVLSKEALLGTVWRGTESDAHVVEVTIARLRQHLGVAAGGIETIFRRGYRWTGR